MGFTPCCNERSRTLSEIEIGSRHQADGIYLVSKPMPKYFRPPAVLAEGVKRPATIHHLKSDDCLARPQSQANDDYFKDSEMTAAVTSLHFVV